MLRPGHILTIASLLGCGCAQTTVAPSASAPPLAQELPSFDVLRPTASIRAGVEGVKRDELRRVVLVQKFVEPELTPEERKALGIDEKAPDLLALYKPARGVEHGVSPLGERPVSAAGLGRADVGRIDPYARPVAFMTYPEAGASIGIQMLWLPAGVFTSRVEPVAGVAGTGATMGTGPVRDGAGRMPYYERR